MLIALRKQTVDVQFNLTDDQIKLLEVGHKYTWCHGTEQKVIFFTGFGFYRQTDWPPNVFSFIKLEARHVNEIIEANKPDTDKISDGYHTFGKLYDFRKMYNAALFNEWASQIGVAAMIDFSNNDNAISTKYLVHKSWKHHDGELCFGGGWFIVSAQLPTGQISNHYEAKDWDLFKVPETEKALFEFDGHTPADVLERLKSL